MVKHVGYLTGEMLGYGSKMTEKWNVLVSSIPRACMSDN